MQRDCDVNCGSRSLARECTRADKRTHTRNLSTFGYVYVHEHEQVQVDGPRIRPVIVPMQQASYIPIWRIKFYKHMINFERSEGEQYGLQI